MTLNGSVWLNIIWIPMSACDFLWLPIAPYGFKIIDSFGHKMFISSQSKLCIWSKNFFDKSCSVWLPYKENVIKSQDYKVIWSQNAPSKVSGTFVVHSHSAYIRDTFGTYSGHIQDTFRTYSWDIQDTFMRHSGHIWKNIALAFDMSFDFTFDLSFNSKFDLIIYLTIDLTLNLKIWI